MYEITMPRLSDSMEVGKIIQWKVRPGQDVREGDVLADIESDKAVMELECFHDGRMAEIVRGDGSEVPVGEVIARLASASEADAAPAPPASTAAAAPPTRLAAGPAAPAPAAEAKPPPRAAVAAPPVAKPAPSAPSAAPAVGERRVAVSPYARKLAAARGVDITRLQGTGEGGRIMARDVERALAERRAAAAAPAMPAPPAAPAAAGAPAKSAAVPEKPAPAAGAPPAAPCPDEELPPLEVAEEEADVEEASFRLRTQVRRVVAAKHVVPHFYVTIRADVTRLLRRRAALKEQLGASVTHLVLLACLRALARHPEINRSYDRGHVIRWKRVNLGLAVDTDRGLTVAVLENAQDLSLADLVERARALAGRAREGRLSAAERRHPTFTVSNLGMFDVEHFAPILNPPSAVTLAVASALDAPVVRDGGIYVGKVMRLTASCDHRILDGAAAARFLQDLKVLLEDPDALLGKE